MAVGRSLTTREKRVREVASRTTSVAMGLLEARLEIARATTVLKGIGTGRAAGAVK